jgi:hypothetical protein
LLQKQGYENYNVTTGLDHRVGYFWPLRITAVALEFPSLLDLQILFVSNMGRYVANAMIEAENASRIYAQPWGWTSSHGCQTTGAGGEEPDAYTNAGPW